MAITHVWRHGRTVESRGASMHTMQLESASSSSTSFMGKSAAISAPSSSPSSLSSSSFGAVSEARRDLRRVKSELRPRLTELRKFPRVLLDLSSMIRSSPTTVSSACASAVSSVGMPPLCLVFVVGATSLERKAETTGLGDWLGPAHNEAPPACSLLLDLPNFQPT
eukprot:scaffold245704_cov40-Tisochrysis_lutea.AAC.2